jgi:hypothetical protein
MPCLAYPAVSSVRTWVSRYVLGGLGHVRVYFVLSLSLFTCARNPVIETLYDFKSSIDALSLLILGQDSLADIRFSPPLS